MWSKFWFKKLHCRDVHERLVSQASPKPTPARIAFKTLKKLFTLGIGWVKAICTGLVGSETTRELPCLQRHLGGQYWRTATMLTRMTSLWRQLLNAVMRGTGPVFFWLCFCFLHFSVRFPSHHTRDSLRKGMLWINGTVNGEQVAKKSSKTSPVQIWACRQRYTVRGKFHGWKIS